MKSVFSSFFIKIKKESAEKVPLSGNLPTNISLVFVSAGIEHVIMWALVQVMTTGTFDYSTLAQCFTYSPFHIIEKL